MMLIRRMRRMKRKMRKMRRRRGCINKLDMI
jgi:hypothetical protein